MADETKKKTNDDGQTSGPLTVEEITALAEAEAAKARAAGLSSTGIDTYYPARRVYATAQQMAQYGPSYFVQTPAGLAYRGEYLVDDKDRISRTPYDPSSDPVREFMMASVQDRTRLINALVAYDLYGGNSKPSQVALEGKGMTEADISAMKRLLSQANTAGRTWKGYLPILEGTVRPTITGGGGARIAFDDAAAIYREESFRLLGRAPTAEETRRAVQYMQSSNANPSVAAEKQAGMVSPDESTAKLMGDGISRMMELL